jgi:hypothetical protein
LNIDGIRKKIKMNEILRMKKELWMKEVKDIER